MVTGAVEAIPAALVDQLSLGGCMILPVGQHRSTQDLILLCKDMDGEVHTSSLLPVIFVLLKGQGQEVDSAGDFG